MMIKSGKRITLIFKRIFILFFLLNGLFAFAQNEKPLNDLFSVCRKAKTGTEDNARFIKQFWKPEDAKYPEAVRLYNSARSDYEEWIEFYGLEVEDAINKKSYKINEETLRAKIDNALNSVNAFNSYYDKSGTGGETAARGAKSVIPTVPDITGCFTSAVGLIKLIKDSKKEKQEILKRDLHEKLERYHIQPFSELK